MITCLLLACGGDKNRRVEPEPTAAAQDGSGSVSAEGKKWGGWRWKGKRDRCFFIHESRCFDSKKAACAAAKCGKDECVIDDSAPAKVSCAKPE